MGTFSRSNRYACNCMSTFSRSNRYICNCMSTFSRSNRYICNCMSAFSISNRYVCNCMSTFSRSNRYACNCISTFSTGNPYICNCMSAFSISNRYISNSFRVYLMLFLLSNLPAANPFAIVAPTKSKYFGQFRLRFVRSLAWVIEYRVLHGVWCFALISLKSSHKSVVLLSQIPFESYHLAFLILLSSIRL